MAKPGRPKGKPLSLVEREQRRLAGHSAWKKLVEQHGADKAHEIMSKRGFKGFLTQDRILSQAGFWPSRHGSEAGHE